ncbi:hypothetical protein ABZ915_20840 [Streptomyces sp. NPDC046915]|uniref:hypothetical protein n=1 Tax=Streptomyces sp. NPDC046915 TaxID=3155257 RepID=UPI0033D38AAA
MDDARIAGLPYADEHTALVDAEPEALWRGIGETLDRSFGRAGPARYARLVGCAERTASGPRPWGPSSPASG